jgi:hypothetical protein
MDNRDCDRCGRRLSESRDPTDASRALMNQIDAARRSVREAIDALSYPRRQFSEPEIEHVEEALREAEDALWLFADGPPNQLRMVWARAVKRDGGAAALRKGAEQAAELENAILTALAAEPKSTRQLIEHLKDKHPGLSRGHAGLERFLTGMAEAGQIERAKRGRRGKPPWICKRAAQRSAPRSKRSTSASVTR